MAAVAGGSVCGSIAWAGAASSCGGGVQFGSGTQGLHMRTISAPSEPGEAAETASETAVTAALAAVSGGRTMNCRGMVMRWREHELQTTLPHLRQWCLRYQKLNSVSQTGQFVASSSGCHLGSTTVWLLR